MSHGSPMRTKGTTTIIARMTSIVSALLLRGAAAEARLQSLELGVDLFRIPQLGNLFLERLRRRAERKRVGMALRQIGATLKIVEARKGLIDLGTGIHFTHPGAVMGAFEAALDAVLASARVAQLALQLGDVGFGRAQCARPKP